MGKKPQNGSKSEDFSSYMSSALQNSMLTGVPQIAGAGNLPKKILRALVFVMCVVGFIYQSLQFLYMYWEYRTIVDVQVTTPRVIELPSLTICNRNGLLMSKLCKSKKIPCILLKEENQEKFCNCNPRYCKNGRAPEGFEFFAGRTLAAMALQRLPQKDLQEFLQPIDSLIDLCTLFLTSNTDFQYDCNLTNYVSVRSKGTESEANVCYTIFTTVGRPDEEPEMVNSMGRMGFELFADPVEYNRELSDVAFQLAFHVPQTVANPYYNGFTIYTDRVYTFILRKVVKQLLPYPYETNCVDYMKKWKERGGWGPTSEVECMQECQLNASLKVNKCVEGYIQYPSNEARCPPDAVRAKPMMIAQECFKKCGAGCLQVSYEIKKEEATTPNGGCSGSTSRGMASLRVFFNHMETTTYIYKPQFENIETFSYLGGYVGMWLGISLVAVFDFVETLVVLMRFPLARLKLCNQHRRTRVVRVQKIQRH